MHYQPAYSTLVNWLIFELSSGVSEVPLYIWESPMMVTLLKPLTDLGETYPLSAETFEPFSRFNVYYYTNV